MVTKEITKTEHHTFCDMPGCGKDITYNAMAHKCTICGRDICPDCVRVFKTRPICFQCYDKGKEYRDGIDSLEQTIATVLQTWKDKCKEWKDKCEE